jgi:peptidoglycan/xylan/chitin deacetylase (PgdA/CDA1 family)
MLKLTFDDGPDPVWTPLLLDVLFRAGARASFFPIAPRAAAHPRLIERMLSEGHTVGLHCECHERHREHDRAWLERDTDLALGRLRGLGVVPGLWRVPWGQPASFTAEVAAARGLALLGWDVDTHDWRGDDAETMFTATRQNLRAGAVVLAHDGVGPGAWREGAEQTLRYVELVARQARRDRLTLSAL